MRLRFLRLKLISKILKLKIAIATSDGNVTSYIIDDDQIRFANRIRPLPNPVEEMVNKR